MNKKDILKLFDLFVEYQHLDDMALVSQLQQEGFSLPDAERCVAFFPIAFGRVVIEQLAKVTFSQHYTLKEELYQHEYPLAEEPMYQMALKVATQGFNRSKVRAEVFQAVINRSAEVIAVNKALNQYVDVDGAKLNLVLWGYQTLGQLPTQPLDSVAPAEPAGTINERGNRR